MPWGRWLLRDGQVSRALFVCEGELYFSPRRFERSAFDIQIPMNQPDLYFHVDGIRQGDLTDVVRGTAALTSVY